MGALDEWDEMTEGGKRSVVVEASAERDRLAAQVAALWEAARRAHGLLGYKSDGDPSSEAEASRILLAALAEPFDLSAFQAETARKWLAEDDRLAVAMDESFWPDDLPFIDDSEAFWQPFAVKVLAALSDTGSGE